MEKGRISPRDFAEYTSLSRSHYSRLAVEVHSIHETLWPLLTLEGQPGNPCPGYFGLVELLIPSLGGTASWKKKRRKQKNK